MRVIARSTLAAFGAKHPETRPSIERWEQILKAARWTSMADIQRAAASAKVVNGDRVRFEVCGGNYRMIVAFDFGRPIAFIKFLSTHADYDRVDALTIFPY